MKDLPSSLGFAIHGYLGQCSLSLGFLICEMRVLNQFLYHKILSETVINII